MKRISILLILISIFSLNSLFSTVPIGKHPYMQHQEMYEDPFYPSSNLTRYIYSCLSKPYSLEWLETYVAKEVRLTFLTYHQEALSLLSTKEILGIIIDQKESYSIVKIDFATGPRIETMWKLNEDGKYLLFSYREVSLSP